MVRHSPTKRSKGEALLHFVICFLLLFMTTGCFILFIAKYDFTGYLPETKQPESKSALTFLPSTATPEIQSPTPTPVPTLEPTPIPLTAYSQRTKISQPLSIDIACDINVTEYVLGKCERGGVLTLRGWGYIEQCDAAKSEIYLVVLMPDTQKQWFYKTSITPGATGIEHDASMGANLDQADFMAVLDVSEYPDGQYKLGLAILNRSDDGEIGSFSALKEQYAFTVKQGDILRE